MCVVACTFLWHPMVCNFECFASLKHAPLCQAEEEHPLAQKARLMAIGKGQQEKSGEEVANQVATGKGKRRSTAKAQQDAAEGKIPAHLWKTGIAELEKGLGKDALKKKKGCCGKQV